MVRNYKTNNDKINKLLSACKDAQKHIDNLPFTYDNALISDTITKAIDYVGTVTPSSSKPSKTVKTTQKPVSSLYDAIRHVNKQTDDKYKVD